MRWPASSFHFALRHLFVASCGLFVFSSSQLAFAYNDNGRISFGGFNSTEKYKDELGRSQTLDVRTLSTRLYYEGTNFWDPGAENQFVADIRDKHDFFEKNDREKLELTDKNSFQVRTLSLRTRPEGEKIAYQIGRFAVPYAGAVYTDGAHLVYKQDEVRQYGVFGGYNPREIDKAYLEFDQDARDFGAYFHYEPKYTTWDKRFLADQAFVRETFENKAVRMYLYQNTYYQWRPNNFLTSLVYLDFEPKFYIQNGTFTGQRQWHRFIGNASFMILDTIEYNRTQDILEDLDPSPYQEANLGGRYKISDQSIPYLKLRYGKRDADKLDRTNIILGWDLPQYFSPYTDFYMQVSKKDEFTRKGTYGKLGIGWYRSVWQTDASIEAGTETDTDGDSLKPLIVELDAGRAFKRNFFGAFGLQLAQNGEVDIFAAYFKFTYKFGQVKTAPMRDGAPLRGTSF